MRGLAFIASLIGVAAGVTAVAPRPAAACTCAQPEPIVSPAREAVDVPINTAVFATGGWTWDPPTVTLTEVASGAPVATTRSDFGNQVMLRPSAPLAPATEYEISLATSFESRTSRFTTGTAADDTAPVHAGLTDFRLQLLPYPGPDGCVNSCTEESDGWYRRVELDYGDAGADIASLVVHVYDPTVPDDPGTFFPVHPFPNGDVHHIVNGTCEPVQLPSFVPDHLYAAELIAFDAAGNRAAPTPARMASAPPCAEATYDDVCTPIECIDSGPPDGSSTAATGCTTGTTGRDAPGPFALLGLIALTGIVRSRRAGS